MASIQNQKVNDLFLEQIKEKWTNLGLKNYDAKRPITRAELAVLLDATLNPFEKTIGFDGQLRKE